jgi:potassium voltage-gated channel Shaw-related subfamily C protein 1
MKGLRIITLSIKTSYSILSLLVFFTLVASTMFGALIFYAERLTTHDQDNNLFISVVEAFWYSVVSLTTIGYGDISPTTLFGRIIGAVCAVLGAILLSLPMTIVVEIFTNFYKHLGARSKLPKQRRRVLPVEAPRLRKTAPNTAKSSQQ